MAFSNNRKRTCRMEKKKEKRKNRNSGIDHCQSLFGVGRNFTSTNLFERIYLRIILLKSFKMLSSWIFNSIIETISKLNVGL
jgi:hypothetical protein